jgi:hypothetical protein
VIRSEPSDPRDCDPTRFPWGSAVSLVLVLVALLTGGTRLVEARWGLAAALAYEFVAAVAWLVAVCCWLAFRDCQKRKG